MADVTETEQYGAPHVRVVAIRSWSMKPGSAASWGLRRRGLAPCRLGQNQSTASSLLRLQNQSAMNRTHRLLRAIAIMTNLMVVTYWLWASVHEMAVDPRGPALFVSSKGLVYTLFVLPAMLSVVALVWIRHRAMRTIAVIANVLIAVWWVGLSAAMPALSVYQLFWSLFACACTIAIVALVLDVSETRGFPS